MSKKKKEQNQKDKNLQSDASESNVNNKQPKEKLVYIFLSAFLFLVTIAMFIYTVSLKAEVSNLDENLTNCAIELSEINDSFIQKDNMITKLQREVDQYRGGIAGRKTLPEKYIEEFKKKGLKNPEQNIINSLAANRNIIPYTGADGEKMQFYNRDQIYILSRNKVLAEIRDKKENYGWLLLKYAVQNDGQINWVVIDSYCALHDK
ncbi:MAG: hypothetical protein ABIJ45_01895 [Candidatus Zixiibacteriota bacterium]